MPTSLGLRLKQKRLEKNLTQNELAKTVGTDQQVIHQYECGKRGKKHPDIYLLIEISKVLDFSLDWLFLGDKAFSNSKEIKVSNKVNTRSVFAKH
jgi:transcriptional regulator with XRE-family HTH domain